jgi:O-antigen ligase
MLSAFRATYAVEALTQIMQYAFIFFVQLPVVLSVVRTRRTAILCVGLVCAGTLAAILLAYLTNQTQGAGRVLVFYSENPNRLGYPAAYLVPLLLMLWRATRSLAPALRTASKLLCLGSGYLAVWAIAASASRSSALGTVAALIVFVVCRPGTPPVRRLLLATSLAAAVGAVAGVLYLTGSLPTTREDRVERSFSAEDQGTLVGDREHLANAAVIAFVQSPYLGSGLDNFRYVTTDYDLEATPQLPHNEWLQLLVQVGVFGTIAFAALLLLWFRDMLSAYRLAAPADRELLWALAAAMTGVLTIFMFAPEMLDRHYWLFVAVGLAAATGARDDHEQLRKTR